MRFVTEGELRDAWREEPFATYRLPEGARLTPGARQFLIDFRIEAPSAGAVDSGERVDDRLSSVEVISDDLAVMGAKLRLLARHAEGISRPLARMADAVGAAWMAGGVAGIEPERGAVPLDAPQDLGHGLHPVFFEAAVLDAELARLAHFWSAASEGPLAERLLEISAVRARLAEAIQRAREEVCDD